MAQAPRDQNRIAALLGTSNADGVTPITIYADPVTHRLLVDLPGGTGTVTDVSVATANGFAGTVATSTTTPVITLSTTVTGILKGDGTAISAAVSNTDYQAPITLTTTGTSGAATFDGTTLNIPNYATGGGTPGGSNTQLQYNNSSAFGGISGATTDGTTVTLTTPVLTGLPTGTGVAAAATASTLASRDANANLTANNYFNGFTTTATAAGTTTLTIASTETQVFTGATTQTVKLPTTSVPQGATYFIYNSSTGAVTVQSSGANTIVILAGGTSAMFTAVVVTPTAAADWTYQYVGDVVASGKKLSVSNTLTLAGTDGTTMTFPTTTATIARTDAANTFTGVQSMTSPAITTGITAVGASFALINTVSTTVTFAGAATTLTVGGTPTTAITHNYSTNATAAATTKTVNLGTGGAASSTSNINIGASAGGTTTINSPTLALGTGSLTMTGSIAATGSRVTKGWFTDIESTNVPTVGGTALPTLAASQTFTGQNKFNNIVDVNNAVTVTTNAGTVPVTFRLNTFTNSSAATMAITMATASAVDGQMTIVRIYDFSAVAQTIGWTNTENSTVSAPTTSNGSTTLPLTVGFMYNSATSKWRCIASA